MSACKFPSDSGSSKTLNPYDSDSLLLNRHFAGQFIVERLMAEHSLCRVYAGRSKETGMELAVKVSQIGYRINERTIETIEQALGIALTIDHPNVVRSLGGVFDRESLTSILVMEMIEPRPLDQFVHDDAMGITIGGVLHQLEGVAKGIDELHRLGMIHRDIKPGNIFVQSPQSRPVIADLGAALGVGRIDEDRETRPCGTPSYMAPEQIIGTSFGPTVDIYSFAVMAYFLFSKALPFEGKSARDHLYAHMDSDPVPIQRRNYTWPSDLDRVLAQALHKEPSRRPAKAADLASAIREALTPYTPIRLSSYFDGTFSRMASGEFPINF